MKIKIYLFVFVEVKLGKIKFNFINMRIINKYCVEWVLEI